MADDVTTAPLTKEEREKLLQMLPHKHVDACWIYLDSGACEAICEHSMLSLGRAGDLVARLLADHDRLVAKVAGIGADRDIAGRSDQLVRDLQATLQVCAQERDAAISGRDAAETRILQMRRAVAFVHTAAPLTNEAFGAIKLRWATGHEDYQADADALICGILHERKRAETAEAERNGLLAIIHRDGGHYTGDVGVTQSVADAHATWARVVHDRDEAQAQVASVRAWNEMRDAWVRTERERDDAHVRNATEQDEHSAQRAALAKERDEAIADAWRIDRQRDAAERHASEAHALLTRLRECIDDNLPTDTEHDYEECIEGAGEALRDAERAWDEEHAAREAAEKRCRTATQTLIDTIGSIGPESVENAAVRAQQAILGLRVALRVACAALSTANVATTESERQAVSDRDKLNQANAVLREGQAHLRTIETELTHDLCELRSRLADQYAMLGGICSWPAPSGHGSPQWCAAVERIVREVRENLLRLSTGAPQ